MYPSSKAERRQRGARDVDEESTQNPSNQHGHVFNSIEGRLWWNVCLSLGVCYISERLPGAAKETD